MQLAEGGGGRLLGAWFALRQELRNKRDGHNVRRHLIQHDFLLELAKFRPARPSQRVNPPLEQRQLLFDALLRRLVLLRLVDGRRREAEDTWARARGRARVPVTHDGSVEIVASEPVYLVKHQQRDVGHRDARVREALGQLCWCHHERLALLERAVPRHRRHIAVVFENPADHEAEPPSRVGALGRRRVVLLQMELPDVTE